MNSISRSTSTMKKKYLIIFILFSSLLANAQEAHLNLTGDAKEVDKLFYRIDLVNGANQTGGAWYPQSFNLDSSFFIDASVHFGNLGAEGFAIVLHSDSIPVGTGAEQLGVPTTGNSFIVEFDLQQNSSTTDGITPHSSFFKNGSLMHQGADLLQNGTLTQGLYSYESIRINWEPNSQTFTINRFGCTNSDLNYVGDIKNSIFEGNTKVFFGFTAATSAIADTVSLWLSYNSTGISENQTICQGEEVLLHAYNSVPTNWSSTEPYIVNISKQDLLLHAVEYEIMAQPINSGYYKVSNLKFCGLTEDSIWVEVLDTLSLSTEIIKNESENTADVFLTIDGGESPYDIEWLLPNLTTSTEQDLIDVFAGLYQVTVTDKNQCQNNLEVELILDSNPNTQEESNEIAEKGQDYFSPNNDNEDDFIRISVKGQSQILDFQGRILRTINDGDLWDGTSDNGELMPSGVYIVKGEEDKQVITILR